MSAPTLVANTTALRWIVLKIHQRCNMDCSYCYVYNLGDDSWKTRPKQVGDEVLLQVCRRIVEQCEQAQLEEFVVELHGGEPLLVGKKRFNEIIELMRAQCPGVRLKFLLQTNGTLLDDEWSALFERHQVSIGISLDGPAEFADRRRYFKNGKGTTNKIIEILQGIRRRDIAPLSYGVLTVVDPALNGADMIDWYIEQGIEFADFLLPLGNRAQLPHGWTGPEPYTRFLLSAFNRWIALDGAAPRIRLFETIIRGHLGQKAHLDALGGDLGALCVVETNGAIGISDVVRFCGGSLSGDVTTVFDIPFARHVDELGVDLVQDPAPACKRCSEFAACGGGYVPHRFDGVSFQNTSLYCESLYALSRRAKQALVAALPPSMLGQAA